MTTQRSEADQAVIAAISALVPSLATALGPDVEVVLHDLARLPDSIVAVAGTVTGRRNGGPGSDLLLRRLRQKNFADLINYESVSTTGTPLRSSSLFIRNAASEPIACLCVNSDISKYTGARDALERMISGINPVPAEAATRSDENEVFAGNVEELSDLLLSKAMTSAGVPVHQMRKSHKMAVVAALDESGYFLLRDSVETAADRLSVTRYTVYNYLNAIRQGGEVPAEAASRA